MENKDYRIVCYVRIHTDETEPLTYTEAVAGKLHLELLQPENIYRIERI